MDDIKLALLGDRTPILNLTDGHGRTLYQLYQGGQLALGSGEALNDGSTTD